MANPVTGRESLSSILGTFDKTAKRLETFIAQQQADADAAGEAITKAEAKKSAAIGAIERAGRVRAKIAELIG